MSFRDRPPADFTRAGGDNQVYPPRKLKKAAALALHKAERPYTGKAGFLVMVYCSHAVYDTPKEGAGGKKAQGTK
jgi:hypothetical protein